MIKKLFSVVLCVSLIPTYAAFADFTVDTPEQMNEKVYCNATLNDNFADDSVLVVMNKHSSTVNKVHEISEFQSNELSETDILSVNDLTQISDDTDIKNIDEDNYKQILHIKLKEKGKKHVLETIKKLEKVDSIEYVGPNYYSTIEDTVPSQSKVADNSVISEAASANTTGSNDDVIIFNPITPNDPKLGDQYGLYNILALDAWDITTGSSSVKVGVIDSGISAHTDLNANLTTGWDFYHNNSITTDDAVGHGTHVAGIIGAVGNNNRGISGVCWNVSLVPLQVIDRTGNIEESCIISAINYATNHDVPIINCSIAGYGYSYGEKIAIQNYPGLFVCGAGNDSSNNDTKPSYPNSYTLDNIVSVAATNRYDALWEDSNYGATSVDITAPGDFILSTKNQNSYDYKKSGTSFASPMVAGVAALIKSVRPEFTAKQIKTCILNGADPLEHLKGYCATGGRLNAFKAVSLAAESTVITGDFNGDGKDEIQKLVPVMKSSENPSNKLLFYGTFNENDFAIKGRYTQYNGQKIAGRVVAGDFNGDGRDDIAAMYDYGNNNPKIHVFKSTGTEFMNWETWFTDTNYFNPDSVSERFTAGDFNGDGKDDIAAMYDYADGTTKILVFISTGSSFEYWDSWYTENRAGYYKASSVTGRFKAGDFNNDGKDDIATMYAYNDDTTQIHVFKSTGTSFNNWETWYLESNAGYYKTTSVSDRFTVGDFNGNGVDDIATMYNYGNGKMQLHVFASTGTAFNNWTSWRSYDTAGSYYPDHTSGFVAGDINGDAKADIISKYNYSAGPTHLLLFKSTGSGFNGWKRLY